METAVVFTTKTACIEMVCRTVDGDCAIVFTTKTACRTAGGDCGIVFTKVFIQSISRAPALFNTELQLKAQHGLSQSVQTLSHTLIPHGHRCLGR